MAQFAGSRSLDERRRRRIAGAWDDDVALPPVTRAGQNSEAGVNSGGVYTPRNRRRLPLHRIVPVRLWKHLLAAGLLLAVGVGIFLLDRESDAISQALGPAAGEFASAQTGRLLPFFNGVVLAAAAQLALLIWWVRSRSRTDFSGKFHIWRWASAAGFLLAATLLLDLHLLWSRTLIWRLQLEFAHAETLCWLAPAVGCGSVLVHDLLADMRNCRGSSTCLWLAVLSWGASVGLRLGGTELPLDAASISLATNASAAIGYYFLFVAMSLQARFVLFVSAEPPVPRPSITAQLVKSAVRLSMTPMRCAVGILRRKRTAKSVPAGGLAKPVKPSKRRTPPPELPEAGTRAFVADAFQDDRRVSRDDSAAGTSAAKRTIRFDEPHELADLPAASQRKAGRSKKPKREKTRASS